jgi:SAM-dependent methyltransferase
MSARRPTRPRGLAGWRWDLLGQVRGLTLEVGCGWGHNFEHYPIGTAVTAFDYDTGRVEAAARRSRQVSAARGVPIPLTVADAERLAWADHAFDSVVGTLVFCSIPNPDRALAEIRRVLRTDGCLFLVEHVRSHHAWLGVTQDGLAPAWRAVTGGCHLNRDTEATVRAAGFTVEQCKIGYAGLLKLLVARPR